MVADLARNPGAYVRYRCIASTEGELIVALMNQTPNAMRDIEYRVTYARGAEMRAVQQTATGPLLPNQVARFATGIPVSSIYDCPVEIVSAAFVDPD